MSLKITINDLSHTDFLLLRAVAFGANIHSRHDADALRALDRKAPGLLKIVTPRLGIYGDFRTAPIFGCRATPKGRALLSEYELHLRAARKTPAA